MYFCVWTKVFFLLKSKKSIIWKIIVLISFEYQTKWIFCSQVINNWFGPGINSVKIRRFQTSRTEPLSSGFINKWNDYLLSSLFNNSYISFCELVMASQLVLGLVIIDPQSVITHTLFDVDRLETLLYEWYWRHIHTFV